MILQQNLQWFENYLTNHIEHIDIDNDDTTSILQDKYGMYQRPNFGVLLFIIYINDHPNVFNILDPLMFAGGTNLFFSYKDIKVLFKTVEKTENSKK